MSVRSAFEVPNTFALPATAVQGCCANTVAELAAARAAARQAGLAFLALGDGSNVVPADRVERFICVINILGVEVLSHDSHDTVVRVGAGENWHSFVRRACAEDWHGLENLALIPGTVGAAPVQNIGAYGVELENYVERVEAIDAAGQAVAFDRDACEFGYRDSRFKRLAAAGAQDTPTIAAIVLRLPRRPALVLDYPDVAARLGSTQKPRPAELLDAVVAIREAKLPDPNKHPNVGSFFKNPIVSVTQYDRLKGSVADLVGYSQAGGERVKLSAAQLIDRAGWKTKPGDRVGCWPTQPLVLVNRGGATYDDVVSYAAAIRDDVASRYDVELELEPSLLS